MINPLAANSSESIKENPNLRGLISFPETEDFFDTLVDRLDMVLGHILTDDFTFFINALPRNHKPYGNKIQIERFNIKNILTYAGIPRLKKFIETDGNTDINSVEKYWEVLKAAKLSTDNSKVSLDFYRKLRQNEYKLKDIIGRPLREYFTPILKPLSNQKPLTKEQTAEYHVLRNFLGKKIENYYYLSVPLIQFAEFDGVVHIILSENDYRREFTRKGYEEGNIKSKPNSTAIGRVISAFSREYEGIILDWDIVGGLKDKETFYTHAIFNDALYEYNDEDNDVLKQLKYRKYYRRHRQYFLDRFGYSEKVPRDLRDQYRKIAILHILLDSYAHNISAHSLTALEWWFKIRADKQNLKSTAQSNIALLKERNVSLDRDIHPLLRFFLDKGAFWTGLTRDYSFGGQIKHLHDILWEEFINNPLYLGTIAFTEGIVKINIHITFLKIVGHQNNVKIRKEVELDDLYAQVDLTKFYVAENEKEIKQLTNFVKPGSNFTNIRKRLRACKVFFPAGVVGVHAFFTILENELRNVKHYNQEQLTQIQKEGLTLNLSIEETSYDVVSPIPEKEKHYYKIGVWLRHPVPLTEELILLRPKRLYADIMENADKEFRPKLGGTYQDKVCAGMLFTNSFNEIENKKSKRGKQFYPWVKAGYCTQLEYKKGEEINDWELSARRALAKATIDKDDPLFEIKQKLAEDKDLRASRALFDKEFKEEEKGYFKKFFHLWKGEDIYEVKDFSTLDDDKENISRFKFIYLPEKEKMGFIKVREAGIVRVINQQVDKVGDAYHLWLMKWLKKEDKDLDYKIDFTIKEQANAQLGINSSAIYFKDANDLNTQQTNQLQRINLVHKDLQNDEFNIPAIRYRNHGIFIKYFYKKDERTNLIKIYPERQGELLEFLGTRICAFDNRIAKRFEEVNQTIIKKQLLFEAHQEDSKLWEKEKQKGFFQYHFLILHLSFIESLSSKERKYSEDDIRSFLDNEILQGKTPPENFIIVIVTGRGRTLWWNNLKDNSNKKGKPSYTSFVTFRSVESMTTAIENALGMNDDIEMKYRMVKILFGS